MAPDTLPTRPPRTRRKHARPEEIVNAAMAVFSERGFAATRLEDVAARAGIGKGTIYLYFPNKEELFRAVVRQRLTPNLEVIAAMIAAHIGPTADLLRQIAEQALGLLETDVITIPKLVLAESGNFPAIARLYAEEVAARGMALMEGVLARGMERGEFRCLDPHSLVPVFAGPIMMMALWKQSLGPHTDISFDPKQVVATHLDVFLRGILEFPT